MSTKLRIQIALAFFAFILIGLNDGALGVLIPSIQTEYGIDKGTVGLMFFSASLGYLTAAFTSGLVVDKFGLRQVLILGVTIFILGTGIITQAPPFLIVLLCSWGIGYGIASIDAGLNSYIALLPNNSALLNYLHAFYGIGALIGPIVASGILNFQWRWNITYFILAGLGVLVVTGIIFIFNNIRPTEHHEDKKEGNVLALALKLRVVWLGAAFLLFYVGVEVTLGSWSFSFLTQERREGELLSGWMVSGYWIGLTLGRLFLGGVAQRIGNRKLIQFCLAGVALSVLIIWAVPFGAASAIGLVLAGFSLGPIFPTSIALMSELVPNRLLPSSIGFMASLGSMGAASFPWIAGILAQGLGLWAILPFCIILAIGMQGIWFAFSAKKSSAVEMQPVLSGVNGDNK